MQFICGFVTYYTVQREAKINEFNNKNNNANDNEVEEEDSDIDETAEDNLDEL